VALTCPCCGYRTIAEEHDICERWKPVDEYPWLRSGSVLAKQAFANLGFNGDTIGGAMVRPRERYEYVTGVVGALCAPAWFYCVFLAVMCAISRVQS
jgi:hypothetical protein